MFTITDSTNQLGAKNMSQQSLRQAATAIKYVLLLWSAVEMV